MIQNTINRDSLAIHAKLDELIRASEEASNALMHAEQLSEASIESILRRERDRIRRIEPWDDLSPRAGKEEHMGGEKDRMEGAWDEVKGGAKEKVGDATRNRDLEADGKLDKARGKGKKAVGHLKDATDNVREGVEDATS